MSRPALIALAVTVALGLSGCSAGSHDTGYVTRSVTEIQPTVTRQDHPAVIDVREPDEFASGHVPGAVNVPLATVPSWAAGKAKDVPYLLICHSGRRSANASAYLAEQGFTQVTNVAGGTAAWIGQGLPVVR